MMNMPSEGMRLAQTQPAPGFSLAHRVADPALHRLGLLKMKIGSDQLHRDRKTGAKRQLKVRERSKHAGVAAVIVCLHPSCSGKSWKTETELIAEHPDHEAMVEAGERHVFGLFSEASLEQKEKSALDVGKLVERSKKSLQLAEAAINDAKDDKTLAEAFERHELAQKNITALQAMASEKAAEIVGFMSDER